MSEVTDFTRDTKICLTTICTIRHLTKLIKNRSIDQSPFFNIFSSKLLVNYNLSFQPDFSKLRFNNRKGGGRDFGTGEGA